MCVEVYKPVQKNLNFIFRIYFFAAAVQPIAAALKSVLTPSSSSLSVAHTDYATFPSLFPLSVSLESFHTSTQSESQTVAGGRDNTIISFPLIRILLRKNKQNTKLRQSGSGTSIFFLTYFLVAFVLY